jgi:hypothetical protein
LGGVSHSPDGAVCPSWSAGAGNLTEFYGREAEDYVAGHLVRDETRTEAMEEL